MIELAPGSELRMLDPPESEDTATAEFIRELDHRYIDGIDVWMLWDQQEGAVKILVNDSRNGESFELPVREGENVRDIFLHPYSVKGHREEMDRKKAKLLFDSLDLEAA